MIPGRTRALAVLVALVALLAWAALAAWGAGCATTDAGPYVATTSGNDAGASAGDDGGGDGSTGASGTFDVVGASSTGRTSVDVTFDAPPDPTTATSLASYAIAGLTLSGTPTLHGAVVSLTTSEQAAQTYALHVIGVVRASDGAPLGVGDATFLGRLPFDVTSAAAKSATSVTVTFDSPPDPVQAADPSHYAAAGLTVTSASASGNVVTLVTSAQAAQPYTLAVTGVARASDGEPLRNASAQFTGRAPFDVASAAAPSSVTVTVTFDAPPDVASATSRVNYTILGLSQTAPPELSGKTVTLHTSGQLAQSYTVNVANVTRASDGEPLLAKSAIFAGTPVLAPTVTNVVVASTSPNNGATPYDTGTAMVVVTGTYLATVACPDGLALDDTDGAGAAVGTKPVSCTVDSDTQLTATFPAGIRTNGAIGWNVRATNMTGTNATSAVRFVPKAGLLVSEVYTGTTGATDHEFLEFYNPTATAIDTSAAGIGLRLHVRSSTGADTNKTLTAVTAGVVPSHGFVLFASSASDAGDAWYAHRDYTFSASLVGNGGVYVSLSATAEAKILDQVGWGTQPAGGFEGAAAANVPSDQSSERKPAGGAGHATDSDDNAADFNAPSTTLTPRGTADAAQP